MRDHPLTPKKPVLSATLAGLAVAIVTAVAAFAAGTFFPPVAWMPGADHAALADAAFWSAFAESLIRDAVAPASVFDKIGGVIDLPSALHRALKSHDLMIAVSARAASCVLAGALLGNYAFDVIYSAAVPTTRVQHISGPRLVANQVARRMLSAAWRKQVVAFQRGIELVAGLNNPREIETRHFLLLGGTGAGKTTILQQMVGSALSHDDRMLVLDAKGDLTARFPTDDFVLLSIEDARSDRWVPGWDFVTAADADELAIELIATTSDPSWSNGARRVLAAIIRFLQDETSARGKAWTWDGLDRMLQMPVEDLHRILASFDPQAATFIDVAQEETRKQAMSFYLVLIAGAAPTTSAFAKMGGDGKDFSVRRWLSDKDARRAIIVRQSQRLPKLTGMMARLVLKAAADSAAEFAAAAAPRPTWFFLDELAQVGKTEAAARLATIGRSASVRLVACVQSPSQLREIYGQDGSQTLLDNLTTKIVGRVAAGATADEVCKKWIGERKVEWWEVVGCDESGRSKSEKKTKDIPVVDPQFLAEELGASQDLSGRPIVKALVIGQGDVAMLEWPVGIWPVRRKSLVRRKAARPIGSSGKRIS